MVRAVANLTISVVVGDKGRTQIVGSALVDEKPQTVTLARDFGNRGAAESYLRRERVSLTERAFGLLSGALSPPTVQETRVLIRQALQCRFPDRLRRILLTGSRARGTERDNSDWDVVAIVEGARRCGPEGPVIKPFPGPDGNQVELVVIAPEDFEHPSRYFSDMRANHIDL